MEKRFDRIVLHAGPDKTGTTAIQYALNHSRSFLAARGIMYSSGFSRNDWGLTLYFCTQLHRFVDPNNSRQSQERLQQIGEQYFATLQREMATSEARTLILSHEGLIHLTRDELSRLHDFLKSQADSIEVVIYARDPVSYAKSAMSQRVKTGRRAWGNHPPVLRYRTYCQKLMAVFGQSAVFARKYDKSLFPEGNVVLDFLSMLELNADDRATIVSHSPVDRNPSLSGTSLQVGDRMISLLGEAVRTGPDFRERFLPSLLELGGDKIELSRRRYRLIMTLASSHTRFLEREFDIVFDIEDADKDARKRKSTVSRREIDRLARQIISDVMPEARLPGRYDLFAVLKNYRRSFTALLKHPVRRLKSRD